jgi:hypothetical protein
MTCYITQHDFDGIMAGKTRLAQIYSETDMQGWWGSHIDRTKVVKVEIKAVESEKCKVESSGNGAQGEFKEVTYRQASE